MKKGRADPLLPRLSKRAQRREKERESACVHERKWVQWLRGSVECGGEGAGGSACEFFRTLVKTVKLMGASPLVRPQPLRPRQPRLPKRPGSAANRVQSSTDKLYNVCGKHPHCQVDNFYILMIHFCKIVLKRGIFEPVSGFDSRL